MTYQPSDARLAPAMSPTLTELQAEAEFLASLRLMAHCFLKSVPDLTDTERLYLYDVARETETRYPMKNIQRFIDLSRRSRNRGHRMQFAELIRAQTLVTDAPLDLIAASNHETEVEGRANVKVRRFEQLRTAEARREAIDAVRENCEAERYLLDALEQTQVA